MNPSFPQWLEMPLVCPDQFLAVKMNILLCAGLDLPFSPLQPSKEAILRWMVLPLSALGEGDPGSAGLCGGRGVERRLRRPLKRVVVAGNEEEEGHDARPETNNGMRGAGERRKITSLGGGPAGLCHCCSEKYCISVICANQPQRYLLALLPEKNQQGERV